MFRMHGIAVGIGILLTTGCAKPFNEQIGLVGGVGLPALAPYPPHSAHHDDEPSINSFDRRVWPVVTIYEPPGQVGHYPTYAANFRTPRDRGPWRPAYPTAADAVVDETSTKADIVEGVVQPPFAALMLLYAPFQMVLGRPPWKHEQSPREPYQRAREFEVTDPWSWFVQTRPAEVHFNDEAGRR